MVNEENEEADGRAEPAGPVSDGRVQTRYGVTCSITIDADDWFYAGTAQNLSEGGIFVATPIVHPIGTRFNLSVHLEDGQGGVIRGIGEVRWTREVDAGDHDPAGIGIQFLALEGDGSERIAAYLRERGPLHHREALHHPEEGPGAEAGPD